ncbi:hypothetical protein M3Y94_00721200 [Aphelenchoides besseyi]|nr:hypothetical protein M3Y94_00721200 [Aphelenchoides besseyi]
MTSRASRSFTRESSESSNRSYTDYDTDSVRRRWRLSPSPRPRSLTTAEVEDILSQDQYTGYTYGDSISYRSDGAEEFLHPYLNQRRHVDFSAGDVSIYRLASGKRAQPTHSDYTRESSFSSWLSSPRVLAKGALRLLLGCLHGLMTFGLITIGLVYSVLHGIGRGFNTWIWPTITSPFNSWRSSEDQNKQSYNAARYGNQQHSIWHDFGSVVAEFLKKTIVWTVWILTLGQIDLSEHFFGRTYDLRSRSPSTSPIKTRSQRSISRTKTVYRVSPAGKQIWSETRVFKTLGGHGDRAFQGMKRMLVGGANDEPSMLRSGVDKISHLFPIDDEKRAKKVVPLLLFLLLLLGLGIAANRNSRQLKAFAQNSVDFVKDQTYGVYNSIKSNSYAIYEKANQVVSGTRSWIYNSVSGIGNWIDGFFSGFFGRLKQNLNYPQRPDWMNFGLFYKPVEWISDLTNYIYRSVSNFFNSFGSWTSDSISGLYDRVKDIGNAANRNSRQLKTYGQNSVDYVKDQTTGVYNSIASNLYDVYEKTTSYPRNVVDFVKNQSNGVYNSITSNAYAAYEKINQLISGTGSSIYNVFYASGSWISGFIGGFVGRLKYNLGYLQRPDWMNLGLLYKPVELTSDFANYVYQSASNFFHFIYSRTVSMIPERKPVEKVIVHEHHHEYKPEPVTQQPIIQQVIVPTVDTDAIRKLIRESLEQYDADKTGQPDYALETSGAEVIGIGCTKVYEEKSRLQYMFGLPLYYSNYGPRTIIQRKSNSIIPGECFAFEGEHGEVIIKLSRKINVTAISYEHLPLILSPEGHIKTAPKSFLVWSLQDYHKTGENKKHLLGKFTYDDKGSALQTFHTEFPDSQFTPIIQLETESNYGSPVTCLYRFRVHGQPVETH